MGDVLQDSARELEAALGVEVEVTRWHRGGELPEAPHAPRDLFTVKVGVGPELPALSPAEVLIYLGGVQRGAEIARRRAAAR